jgi:hypothetical protein
MKPTNKRKYILRWIRIALRERKMFMMDVYSRKGMSSSKRYVMIQSLRVLFVMAMLNQVFQLDIDPVFPLTFGSLAAGTAITNAVENVKNRKQNNNGNNDSNQ